MKEEEVKTLMVTEQQLLEFMRETAYKPMTYKELETHFEIGDAAEFKHFLQCLTRLEEQGLVLRTRSDRYGVPERMNLLRGRLQTHPKGFGFLIPDEAEHPDVYIHTNDLKGAMNGDTVFVRVTAKGVSGGKLEGEVVRIVTRANTQIVGELQHHESYGFVIADDKRIVKDIFIPKHGFNGAQHGDKVVVNIVTYPEGRSAAEGEVVEILGHKDEPGVDIVSIIRKYGLPESFSDDVLAEASQIPDTVQAHELEGRRDLRGKTIVTIDGADAKDLDDAISIERTEDGHYVLGVHIADVGHYVRENSLLDQEAYNRGCSVYLVDRVIPMLPPSLSNGICSLHPHVDRLTLTCEMTFDEQGKQVTYDIYPSVISTTERMTYDDVRDILVDKDMELRERYAELVPHFELMEQLALRLRKKRMGRGAIDFDLKESKVIVDDSGKPTDIIKLERSIAEQMIEEFMLVANETVAEHFYWLKVPFLYRIHEDPDSEKLLTFFEFVSNFGYVIRGKRDAIHPRALQQLLKDIEGTKEETVISTVMLRSMKQAKYADESIGHFGLAAKYYSHFTAPIRRYPDLTIHRIISEILRDKTLSPKRQEHLASRMGDIAQQSSERERVAVDAERETDELKKAEFMLDKIGEEFEGIISGVTSFGMFVELDNSVEGLIRLSGMSDDYYHYHERQLALIGERTSKVYRIGDEVRVRVANVNIDEHTIDFEMVDMKPRKSRMSIVGSRGIGGGGSGRGSRGSGGSGRNGGGGSDANSGSSGRGAKSAKGPKGTKGAKGTIGARGAKVTKSGGKSKATGKSDNAVKRKRRKSKAKLG